MLSDVPTAFTFDDFIIVPQHSLVRSRSNPETAPKTLSIVAGRMMGIPIISSPMNTITEKEMCDAMADMYGSSVLHRYMTIEEQAKQFREVTLRKPWVAIGASGDYLERATELYKKGARDFCIDVANGHSQICIEAVYGLVKHFGEDIKIMAGNVCTFEGTEKLVRAGADVIRVGIGPGSMCTTRIVTGHGLPQLSALEDCVRIKEEHADVSIVADGGIRSSGDINKAIAIGADAVMIGGLFAGTKQTPGEEFFETTSQKYYKTYAGMASEFGRKDWFDKSAVSFVPEGDYTRVEYKGDVKNIINRLVGGLRVGMSYSGAMTLDEYREKAIWRRVTENGRVEGTPNRKMFK